VQGHDFPEDLASYKLVIHCGACMWNRREMLSRIQRCEQAGVPITNYGLTIAYSLGIFDRALAPFPEALSIWRARQPGGACMNANLSHRKSLAGCSRKTPGGSNSFGARLMKRAAGVWVTRFTCAVLLRFPIIARGNAPIAGCAPETGIAALPHDCRGGARCRATRRGVRVWHGRAAGRGRSGPDKRIG
jgi:hypothetical protein